jgi:hypothetical protein
MMRNWSSSEAGFFSISVAVALVCASIIVLALIALVAKTNQLADRRGEALRARYAAQALLVRTRREIETSGLALPAWQEAQRREVWEGQTSAVRVFVPPLTDVGAECVRSLRLTHPGELDSFVMIGGVMTSTGFRAEIGDILVERPGGFAIAESRLLRGKGAPECIAN